MSEKTEIIENLKQLARETWKTGNLGEQRAVALETFVTEIIAHYSEKLGFTEIEILKALEKRRNYCAVNYYQAANFPRLDDVHIYETQAELLEKIDAREFRCPSCSGISSNPYECNAGDCDWKSYGLFKTLGKGYRFTIRESFLEHGKIDEIFMPVIFETKQGDAA